MRVYRVVVAYEGTAYSGWPVQPGRDTVQGLVIGAARGLLGDDVRVTGASRTDAGVHALRQTVSIRAARAVPAGVVARALNAGLPRDVRVLECGEADASFDARRAAVGKRYGYLLEDGSVSTPFLLRYAWSVSCSLDVARMRLALAPLLGR